MTPGVEGRAVHIVKNLGAHPIVLILEPWGGEYDIDPQDSLELVIDGKLDSRLEIEIQDGVVTITSDGPDLAITRDGKPVPAR